MKLFHEMSREDKKSIQYILHDIDDTITDEGKLLPESYEALWRLSRAGYKVIPVTGRPAGWCDLIIRQWPVDAVVGENGAFVYYFDNEELKTFTHPSVAGADIRNKLEQVKEACLAGVPGCRVAKDQFARIYDLAIDFNEDHPRLGFEAAYKIQSICESLGAEAKVSSIHVNAWFGKYDKVSMTKLFFETVWQETALKEKVLFFGDSPNDEPMFEYFPQACAVANIKPFLDKLTHKPAYITTKEGGMGFAEAVNNLLQNA